MTPLLTVLEKTMGYNEAVVHCQTNTLLGFWNYGFSYCFVSTLTFIELHEGRVQKPVCNRNDINIVHFGCNDGADGNVKEGKHAKSNDTASTL